MGVVVALSIPQEIVKVRLLYEYPPVFSGPLDVLCGSLVDPGVGVGPLCGLWRTWGDGPHRVYGWSDNVYSPYRDTQVGGYLYLSIRMIYSHVVLCLSYV